MMDNMRNYYNNLIITKYLPPTVGTCKTCIVGIYTYNYICEYKNKCIERY